MSSAKKPKAVVDTNLLISAAIIPRSLADKVFKLWLRDSFKLIISIEQLEELQGVSLRRKFTKYPLFSKRIKEIISKIGFLAEKTETLNKDHPPVQSRDMKDNYLISSALARDVDYLVTGDEDLLILNGNTALGKLKIISIKDFLSIL